MKHTIKDKQAEKRASVETGVIIKLGMDVHLRQITVVRQLGDQAPQPAQRFTKEALIVWVRKMLEAGATVHSCYEAGVMGYTLHRELAATGAQNLVVAPQKLAGAKRQKTDALDACALCERLDRYVRGNHRALSIVRVPTPEQEQARAKVRLRDQLGRQRRMAEARGRCLLMGSGYEVPKYWWQKAKWAALVEILPEWLRVLMAEWQAVAADLQLTSTRGNGACEPSWRPRHRKICPGV